MRIRFVMLCLWAATAWADAPTPTGLDLIQARYAGTWKVEDVSYDTEVTRAGTKEYELTRICVLSGTALDCKFMAQGALQGEQRFTWDAAAGVYHVDMDV